MSKAHYCDDVNGSVIGPILHRCELIAPNGRLQSESHAKTMQDAVKWGKSKKAEMISLTCGDGKPLSDHKRLAELIYGKGEWDVRFYG